MILQAHHQAIRSMEWSHNDSWMVSGDDGGEIKSLACYPFHEKYFVSGSSDGCIFHGLVGHGTQVEIPNAHDNSVWDIAWHPTGYLLVVITRQSFGAEIGLEIRPVINLAWVRIKMFCKPALSGRMPGNFAAPEGPTTPGPFAAALTRNEGTIPGIGVPMPLSVPSLDASSQGGQKQHLPGSMSFGAPPLPPGPHPSFLVANQQHGYQQNLQQIQRQQPREMQQQTHPMPMASPTMLQLQPPSHMPLLPHPYLPRPPPQMPPLVMPSPVPSSMQASINPPSSMRTSHPMPMPGPMGMQDTMNQMPPPLAQGHFMGMNPMHSGINPMSIKNSKIYLMGETLS